MSHMFCFVLHGFSSELIQNSLRENSFPLPSQVAVLFFSQSIWHHLLSTFHVFFLSYLFKSNVMVSSPKQTNKTKKQIKLSWHFSGSLTGKWALLEYFQGLFITYLKQNSFPQPNSCLRSSLRAYYANSKSLLHKTAGMSSVVFPQKMCQSPNLRQNVTLFGNTVFTEAINLKWSHYDGP